MLAKLEADCFLFVHMVASFGHEYSESPKSLGNRVFPLLLQ